MSSQCLKVMLIMIMGLTLIVVYLIFPGPLPNISKFIAKYTTNENGSLESTKLQVNHGNYFKQHNKTPLVLLINGRIWSRKLKNIGKAALLHLPSCSHRCHYSFDRKSYEEIADLVAIQTWYFREKHAKIAVDRIKARQDKTGQIWLGVTVEAPLRQARYLGTSSLDSVFNWIVTYRRDADIYRPYGRFVKQKLSTESTVSVPAKREKLASWLVSHCKTNSMRRLLVQNLQRFILIDVYGKCQQLKCPRNQDCRAFLGRTYKFYLAFENSLCLDYVTEKVFLAYKNDLVPVIYAWLNDSSTLPPGSYINALDFNTPKDLADYLLYLDAHEDEYLKFFEWKRNYRLELSRTGDMLCEACAKLNRHLRLGDRRHVKRHSSMLGWLNSWRTNSSSGLKFKFGRTTLSTGYKVCVDASKSKDLLAWLTR